MASVGPYSPLLFASVLIEGERLARALLDTESFFSMLSAELCSRLVCRPAIQQFEGAIPDVIAIDGVRVAVSGYAVVPLVIGGVEVVHPLLVIRDLPYSLLIGTDILRPHAASVSVVCGDAVLLGARECDVCRECRLVLECDVSATATRDRFVRVS